VTPATGNGQRRPPYPWRAHCSITTLGGGAAQTVYVRLMGLILHHRDTEHTENHLPSLCVLCVSVVEKDAP
jgi:hypothetical protein